MFKIYSSLNKLLILIYWFLDLTAVVQCTTPMQEVKVLSDSVYF